nr:hypothetical protein HK105_001335 [Polyrhizophydium stewartii]
MQGVPAIMSPHLSRSFKSLISCFIFRNDIVPCLSLGLVRDFRNVTVNLCNEKGMAERVIGKVLGIFRDYTPTGAPDEDSLWYWALLKTLRADMKAEKLYPPGTVYWINANTTPDMVPSLGRAARAASSGAVVVSPKKTIPISIHEVDDVEIAFSELVFSTKMFTDHSPHHYEGSLELVSRALAKLRGE